MRSYLMGFKQKVAIELNVKADELIVLRYFVDFQGTGVMKHEMINGKVYHWLSYKKVMEDLPIININTNKGIAKRFDRLAEVGLLEKEVIKNAKGTFTYFRLGENYLSLIENDKDIKVIPKENKVAIKDNIDYKTIIDYLNLNAGKRYACGDVNKSLIRKLYKEGYTLEDFKKVIDNKVSEWKDIDWINTKNGKTVYGNDMLRPSTLFGNKFDQYLNQTNQRKKVTKSTAILEFT